MVENKVLKARLAPLLKRLMLSEEEQEKIVKEINYLSDLLIDNYLAKKALSKDKNYGD